MPGPLQLCSYGLNFKRVDQDLLIAGIGVRDFPAPTPASRKMLRAVGSDATTRLEIDHVVARALETTEELEAELRARRDAVIDEYRASQGYQQDVLDLLRPELERTLAQVHDYKQFVQQIVQNLDVVLETKFPGLTIDEKLDRASHEEAAMYWAAQLMDEKLDAALFMLYPDRIHERQRAFRFHGLVTKYLKIYRRRIDAKRLRLETVGESWADIEGNPRAIAAIPHALIDNAIKYAPEGSEIRVIFDERPTALTLTVVSFGPRIDADERDRIFEPFYRGRSARSQDAEGTGFGLAQAQQIATAIGSRINVSQEDSDQGGSYRTTFGVTFADPVMARRLPSGAPIVKQPKRRRKLV